MRGWARRINGAHCRWEKEIVALGPISADHLILIHQVKQGHVNRRCHLKYTNDKDAIRTTTETITLQKTLPGRGPYGVLPGGAEFEVTPMPP